MIRGRFARLSALAAIPLWLVGCAAFYSDWAGFDPGEAPQPSVRAVYATGSATLEITRDGQTETIILDRVGPASQLVAMMGASVTWRDDEGWVLLLSAFDPSEYSGVGAPITGDVQIERVDGHNFWIAGGYVDDRCIVDLPELSETAVNGSATCLGLRWMDGTGGGMGFGQPTYIEGEEAFDAKVTFEAAP